MERACRWHFDGASRVFDGFTDGTTWNGWDNVQVTPETHADVIAWFEANGDDASAFREMEVEPNGRVSYAYGWCCTVLPDPNPMTVAYLAMGAKDALRNDVARDGFNLDAWDGEIGFVQKVVEAAYLLDACNALIPDDGHPGFWLYEVVEAVGREYATQLYAGTDDLRAVVVKEMERADYTPEAIAKVPK